MKLEEIKQLINASGGKLILSDGNLKDSFIVMKISDYLSEKKEGGYGCDCFTEEVEEDDFDQIDFTEELEDKRADLTDSELLDKINSDIDELKRRKQEDDLVSVIEDDFLDRQKEEELDYEKI